MSSAKTYLLLLSPSEKMALVSLLAEVLAKEPETLWVNCSVNPPEEVTASHLYSRVMLLDPEVALTYVPAFAVLPNAHALVRWQMDAASQLLAAGCVVATARQRIAELEKELSDLREKALDGPI